MYIWNDIFHVIKRLNNLLITWIVSIIFWNIEIGICYYELPLVFVSAQPCVYGVYVYLFMCACPHQHVSGSEQVAEGVVEQVDEWGSIQVSVTHHLRSKQSLPRAAA